ncbi:MAG: efflux RND transporter permease subunit [Pseudomonadota bacterium]
MTDPARNWTPVGGVIGWFTRHRTAANLLMVLVVVLGIAAMPRMQAQFFPDVVVDNVSVSVTWEGASAEDMDGAIVQILSPALREVEGVTETVAVSREQSSTITLDFEPGWDMGRATDEVQAAVDAVTELPADADVPRIARAAWRDRVTDVVVTGPFPVEQLGRYADEVVNRLYDVGVTRTTLRGLSDPRLAVEVSGTSLIEHDITLGEIAALIAEEADADPAGDVTGGAARVRVGTEKRTIRQLSDLVLRSTPDGGQLRLGDIALILDDTAQSDRAYFVGDARAVVMRVDRSADGDALEIQAKVEDVIDDIRATLPEGVEIALMRTRSEAISSRLSVLLDNGLAGLGLVLALLFLFLNARTAFWVAAGIPVAMMAAIAVMYVAGLTLNMISLFAMIITIGIVVDDAIVVGEHADARQRKLGEPPVVAAERAARRMALPVFCATLTTVIAFFGLTVIGGRFGELIFDIPLTVIALLLASLLECFLILPHHMSKALAQSAREHWYDWPSKQVNRGFVWVREHAFRPVMHAVIKARYPVLAAAVALLASQTALLIDRDVPWRFFNAPESGSVTANFVMAAGADRGDSMEMVRELQRATEALAREYEAQRGANPLRSVVAQVGGNTGGGPGDDGTRDPDQRGAITIELTDADLRPFTSFEFAAALRDKVVRHPLVEELSFRGWRSGPGEDALRVEFFGAPVDVLKSASLRLQEDLIRLPEVTGVQDNLSYDKDELILDLTPQGQALGLTIDMLASDLRARINGLEAARFPVGPRTAEIRVLLPEEELTADFLERIQIRAPGGTYVPLADVVRVESRTGFSTVRRENGVRLVSVTGDIDESDAARATEIATVLSEQILPAIASEKQVDWRMTGLAEQERDFLRDAQTGFAVTLIGIYLVLALVFASWSRPLVVMAVIPFGLTGAIWGHAVWDVPFSMFSVIGLLGLSGIIINDSIVLVTTIDEHATRRGLAHAIVEGAADRLRPVILTTLTTVLGLTPLLFEQSTQAQFMKPTVITLVYGLGFGVALVLLVVPAIMAIQHDLQRQFQALRRGLKASDGRIRRTTRAIAGLIALWFLATLGHTALTGDLPAPLAGISSGQDETAVFALALGLFSAGAVILAICGYAVAAGFERKRPQPA